MQDIEKIYLYPKPTPVDIGSRPDKQVIVSEEIYLYKVGKALITSYGYVIKNFNVLYGAVSPFHRTGALDFKNLFAFLFLKKKVLVPTPCISIANGWLDSYYHFTLESLPKLYMMREYLSTSTLVFHSIGVSFHAQWFEIIGVKNIKYINDDEVVKTPLAITTSFPAHDLNHHPVILPEFRQWILDKIENKNSLNFKKIFIGRKKQRHRKLLNEDKVSDLLKGFGFRTLYMEDYPVADQVRIFYNAEQIICIHGAALTNLCFSKKKTKVIDLNHEDFVQWCFLKLCIILEIEYEIVSCEGSDKSKLPGYDDITVNMANLKSKVERWVDV